MQQPRPHHSPKLMIVGSAPDIIMCRLVKAGHGVDVGSGLMLFQ